MRSRHLTIALLAALTVAANGTAAVAAGPRPLFQSPAPCGQVWTATTYASHDYLDSIDMTEWENGNDIGTGEPVLASADGIVTVSGYDATYGNRVDIDHGNGWKTRYGHLVEPSQVSVGQSVSQGEMVGRIGQTGKANGSDHLHYTQLADGDAKRVWFDGAAIVTNGADMSTWNKYGQDDAEQILSHNCPNNSFVDVAMDGANYQLAYKPGTGAVAIDRIRSDHQGVTTTYSSTWSRRWTNFAAYMHNGRPHLLSYKASTGEVDFDRFATGGTGTVAVGSASWAAGWSHILGLTVGGKSHFIIYSQQSGRAKLLRINDTGNGTVTLWQGDWGKGWTHFTPFVRGGVQYFFNYRGGSGDAQINKVALDASGAVAVTNTWWGGWTTGYTHFTVLQAGGQPHLLAYKGATGLAKFLRLDAGGAGLTQLGWEYWSTGWTSITPYAVSGTGYFQAYKGATGAAVIERMNPDGADSTRLWAGTWTTGWA